MSKCLTQAMQQQRSPEIDFCEIIWVVRFSTFATISAQSELLHLALNRQACLFGALVLPTENPETENSK
jgi:hypothetical protein